ncbi:hypothetical protein HGRIS_007257 [Hohenbuehelia grisea]|uniref:Uncharacterized protein n=1 Tax=Hohenbuehelia grisea TaxID=104357 RepID=A0ABR3JBJ2_9AGAR
MPRSSAAKKSALAEFEAYILDANTAAGLQHITAAEMLASGCQHPLLQNSPGKHSSLKGVAGETQKLLRHLLSTLSEASRSVKYAAHQQKRLFIRALFGGHKPPSINDHIAKHGNNIEEAIRTSLAELGFQLVVRQRDPEDSHKFRNVVIVEQGTSRPNTTKPHRRGVYTVSPEAGFYFVQPDESVVFISMDQQSGSGSRLLPSCLETWLIVTLELVVLRGIALGAPFAEPLYDWLMRVVETACQVRRNCRLNHPGSMVQWGLNLGARHCRILGWAKSYCRKLSDLAMRAHDSDAIGAMSLFWSLAQACLPTEVTHTNQDYLKESSLPSVGTRHIASGCGFAIEVDGVVYDFSTAERAPPEGTATFGYSSPGHSDASATNWTLSWIIKEWGNENGGNAYADLSLKVVVIPAAGTMLAHRPRAFHVTTFAKAKGSGTAGFTIAFTEHVAKAYKEFAATNGQGAVLPFSPEM